MLHWPSWLVLYLTEHGVPLGGFSRYAGSCVVLVAGHGQETLNANATHGEFGVGLDKEASTRGGTKTLIFRC
ncbi:hypothetical protein BKA59DRAFT_482526 [Fusarium tricinctum]|uniref:Uncharacterized protein n=1 Tax=Fusarium tricinctum TaxID=61284 RepID=A0A8K0RPQ8_9HYPO|nr:hypothetical protein BKA59DRAFT_482526 [Fusarium tricinctum]